MLAVAIYLNSSFYHYMPPRMFTAASASAPLAQGWALTSLPRRNR